MDPQTKEQKSLPTRPLGIIASLSTGLDAAIQAWWILLFPIVLDLFLWFGRHLSIRPVAERIVAELVNIAGETSAFDFLIGAASEINYFSLISVAPLGIPSLMTLKLPQTTPIGLPGVVEIESELTWLALFAGLSLLGLLLGAIYLGLIAQQVRDGKINLGRLSKVIPRYYLSILALIIILMIVGMIASVPAMLIAALASSVSPLVASLIIWIVLLLGMWLVFHLVFSVHGLLLSEEPLLASVWNSLRLTAMNSFATMGLFAVVFAISAGLNYLWTLPEEDSWMLFVGILGHAVISSGLVAATFVFYQDRYRYWQEVKLFLTKETEQSA